MATKFWGDRASLPQIHKLVTVTRENPFDTFKVKRAGTCDVWLTEDGLFFTPILIGDIWEETKEELPDGN